MIDSYEIFFEKAKLSKKQFFEFGIEETIFANLRKAEDEWKELLERIREKSPDGFYIRGYGRNSVNTTMYEELYKKVFKIIVKPDTTGNSQPKKIIEKMTLKSTQSKKQHEKIVNYQVSHVFGRTKNIFMFTAPWNVAFVPKIMDPFTGHEAQGSMVKEFTAIFQNKAYEKFGHLIEEYNQIILDKNHEKRIGEYLDSLSCKTKNTENERKVGRFIKSVLSELRPVNLR